jgi:Asp/Glu/hydantoin racemase
MANSSSLDSCVHRIKAQIVPSHALALSEPAAEDASLEDGSAAIVMGCAGMARHRGPLEQALGIPLVDPTQAAVTMALGAVQFAHH